MRRGVLAPHRVGGGRSAANQINFAVKALANVGGNKRLFVAWRAQFDGEVVASALPQPDDEPLSQQI